MLALCPTSSGSVSGLNTGEGDKDCDRKERDTLSLADGLSLRHSTTFTLPIAYRISDDIISLV